MSLGKVCHKLGFTAPQKTPLSWPPPNSLKKMEGLGEVPVMEKTTDNLLMLFVLVGYVLEMGLKHLLWLQKTTVVISGRSPSTGGEEFCPKP